MGLVHLVGRLREFRVERLDWLVASGSRERLPSRRRRDRLVARVLCGEQLRGVARGKALQPRREWTCRLLCGRHSFSHVDAQGRLGLFVRLLRSHSRLRLVTLTGGQSNWSTKKHRGGLGESTEPKGRNLGFMTRHQCSMLFWRQGDRHVMRSQFGLSNIERNGLGVNAGSFQLLVKG